ncbi:copper chaperone PCu(A)C [Nocardiopsis gilva YIM 90087]|uniref:Copper chaperone PCu(A)C n=1 Tax=Nocardiopsis gilva YIM 90087 TaxID=1235441 RepID=A0A223S584_9ACTN|nr:copper chaperone PCu(A)C [Nocardiopsis gilva]ASU83285.1 copper chaperone PCu(A)C [Nocardiopsis gilva YIM 90087]
MTATLKHSLLLPAALLAFGALSACGGPEAGGAAEETSAADGGSSEPSITVTDATVRVPSNPDVTAGYLTIENTGGADDVLTGVTTDAAKEVQMHDTVNNDGQMKMEQQDTVSVPAGDTVKFESGGLHLMLMEPKGVANLEAGDTVTLTLSFKESGDIETAATIEDPMQGTDSTDSGSHEDMDHESH